MHRVRNIRITFLLAFLYSNGQMVDLGTLPGDQNSAAYGINDAGEVVGTSFSMYSLQAVLYSKKQMFDLQ